MIPPMAKKRTVDIRKIILDELKRQGHTRYWLATHDDMAFHYQHVYRWLQGHNDAGQRLIENTMEILGLEICST